MTRDPGQADATQVAHPNRFVLFRRQL